MHFARSFPLLLTRLLIYVSAMVLIEGVSGSSFRLDRRAATTDAVCRPQFDWMNNSKGQSPCLVGAYLLAPCQRTGEGSVRAINTTYLPPTAEGAEACWCSWGVYNTLEACALCQNDQTYTLTWYNYRSNCSAELQPNTEFYPSGTPISDETGVPFWATTNPSTWDNGMFNLTQAQALASEGKEDVTEASRQASSSSSSSPSSTTTSTETSDSSDNGSSVNVGAIAGGVAGGVVAIAAGGLVAFFCLRRRKNRTQPQWDYKEPDTTVSPLVASELPGSGPNPAFGGYSNVARIDTGSNVRVDLTGTNNATLSSPLGGYGSYSPYNEYGGANPYTVASSSSGAGDRPSGFTDEASPPPYTDAGVTVTPGKQRR